MQKAKKVITIQESIKRMAEDGINQIVMTYKDSAIGRHVITYQSGRFTHLIVIKNHPKLTWVQELSYHEGLNIIKNIFDGRYSLQSFGALPETVETKNTEKELSLYTSY